MRFTLEKYEVREIRLLDDGHHHVVVVVSLGVADVDHSAAIKLDFPIDASEGDTIEQIRVKAIASAKAAMKAALD